MKSKPSSALDVAAAYNADFVLASLPSKNSSILDVGCGDGNIAAMLQSNGVDVTAIDTNAESVKKAQDRGVKATVCAILDFNHQPFDAIFMSRSLHHMPALAETVAKVQMLLKSDGLLIIDDFGFERVEARSAEWLQKQLTAMRSNGLLAGERHKWLLDTENIPAKDASLYWQEKHWIKHDLHTSKVMKKCLTDSMQTIFYQDCPNLFRFLCDLLPQTDEGAAEAEKLLADEQYLIANEEITANGFRLVLRNSTH